MIELNEDMRVRSRLWARLLFNKTMIVLSLGLFVGSQLADEYSTTRGILRHWRHAGVEYISNWSSDLDLSDLARSKLADAEQMAEAKKLVKASTKKEKQS